MDCTLLSGTTDIVATDRPEPGLVAAIARPLADFNAAFVGVPQFRPLVIALRSRPAGEVIGGLCGDLVYGWLSIQVLFLPERLRGQGIGAALVRRAEAEARAHNCRGIVVNTFSFQARPFYERMGFTHFGTLEDCPPGYRCFYLSKRL